MSAIKETGAGATRPPLLLVLLRRMARLCLLLLAFDAHAQSAPARCIVLGSSPIGLEGFDGNDPFGALLKVKDDRWSWEAAHGGAIAICPSCADENVARGVLRLGLAPYLDPGEDRSMRAKLGQTSASPVEFALDPRVIAIGMWVMTNLRARDVRPATDIMPVTLWGVSGLARAVEIDLGGTVAHGVAVALQDRCFSLFGVFFRKDNSPAGIDDVRQIDAAVTLDRYRPAFTPEQVAPLARPAPRIEFPLGDARKSLEEELQRQER